ncbi:MOB kinase activator-like 1A [Glycine soja]|uniref:MOB kinase activator-like 1A n=1 Tax=Glycine soja TaxID=3848 RepID=A0A445GUW4_GLYSO|nr:MOB kinase activator-like 1A [Glycine soja]
MTSVMQTLEQQVYLSKLMGYDYLIQYCIERHNVVANALSRSDGQCLILSVPQFAFLDELQRNLSSSHMGVTKTLARLLENFFWKGMRKDVRNFVAQCITCQSTKYETKRPTDLLQPLPVPTAVWEDFFLDFITGLPLSNGNTIPLFLLLLTVSLRQLISVVFQAISQLSRLLNYSLNWSANTTRYPVAWFMIAPLSLLANFGVYSSSLAAPNSWLGLSPEDTTWERWDDLSRTFHLEDKVILPGDGNVSDIVTTDSNKNGLREEETNDGPCAVMTVSMSFPNIPCLYEQRTYMHTLGNIVVTLSKLLQSAIFSLLLFPNQKTFRPKKSAPSGSKGAQLQKHIDATLGSGNLREAVKLPPGEDINEWLAVNTVDFFNQVNILFGTLTEFCTPSNCPSMTAGPKYEYRWADGVTIKKPIEVSAPKYVEYLMDWIESQLDDETIFPQRLGAPFPTNFRDVVKTIFKRLFRVYAHIYHSHFQKIVSLKEEAHLNTCFKHFVLFTWEFRLIDKVELAPLEDLVESIIQL